MLQRIPLIWKLVGKCQVLGMMVTQFYALIHCRETLGDRLTLMQDLATRLESLMYHNLEQVVMIKSSKAVMVLYFP